jgi:hypothetical protein
MHLSGFVRFVWAATFFGQIVLLWVLFVRRRAASFPAFTLYIAESVCIVAALRFFHGRLSVDAFRGLYLRLNILDSAFQLLVVCELAVHVFRPTGEWARDVFKTFVGVVCASILVAALLTWLDLPIVRLKTQAFMLRSDFFATALMSELFVGMIVLSSTAGLPWKTHTARVAQGLGTYSIVCLARDIAINSVALRRHMQIFTQSDHVRNLAYLGCEVFWIAMLWREAPAPRELPEKMRAQIYTLQRRVEYDLIRIRSWRRS